jgi:homeobox protein ESX1
MTEATQEAPPRADGAAAWRAQVPISPNDPAVPVPPIPEPPPGPDLPEPPVRDPPGPDAPLPGEDPDPPPAGDPPSDPPIRVKEIGGPAGPEPTRYGDWERKGRACDF